MREKSKLTKNSSGNDGSLLDTDKTKNTDSALSNTSSLLSHISQKNDPEQNSDIALVNSKCETKEKLVQEVNPVDDNKSMKVRIKTN